MKLYNSPRVVLINSLSPHDALKHHLRSLKTDFILLKLRGFSRKISMKLLPIHFLHFSPTSSHFHPLQVENCDSNSRLVVDEDENGKFRPERVKMFITGLLNLTNVSCYDQMQDD